MSPTECRRIQELLHFPRVFYLEACEARRGSSPFVTPGSLAQTPRAITQACRCSPPLSLVYCPIWIQPVKASGLWLCLDLCLRGTRDSPGCCQSLQVAQQNSSRFVFSFTRSLSLNKRGFFLLSVRKAHAGLFLGENFSLACVTKFFKSGILFLSNSEKEALKKLDEGYAINISSYITSEVSCCFPSIRRAQWCVCSYLKHLWVLILLWSGSQIRQLWESRGGHFRLNPCNWFGELHGACVLGAASDCPPDSLSPIAF